MKNNWKFSFVSVVGFILVISVFYTNCSQKVWEPSPLNVEMAEVAYTPLDQLQTKLVAEYGSSLTASICNDSQRYFCDLRHFSPKNKEHQSEISYPCLLIEDIEICPKGLRILLDTSELTKVCVEKGCDSSEIENTEYFCYLALPNNHGTYPLQGHFDSVEQGVSEIRRQCLRLSQMAAGGF